MMTLIFGRGVLAVGVVLAAFMAGLALGSYLLGKSSDKSRNPLRLYGLYEVGIGVTALGASAVLMNIAPLYIRLHEAVGDSPTALFAARFLLAFAILIVPTILMGATFPILSRIVIRQLERVGRELGKLYAVNTLGAIAGTIAAGFFLIRFFGLQGTIWTAAVGNLLVGLIALAAAKRYGAAEDATVAPELKSPGAEIVSGRVLSRPVAVLLLVTFAFSGVASFAYEIFWTRSLVFLLGNTTYAFTLMLTAFLSGIALGGYAVRFIADRLKSRLHLFALIEILIGVSSAASLPLLFFIVESESMRSFVLDMAGEFGSMVMAESVVALLLMLVPATLIGATLPLMGRIFVTDLRLTGTTVGKVYAVNTVGNVAGALLPGLLILPLVGIQKGILLMAALNCCLGLVVLAAGWKNKVVSAAVPLGIFLLLAVAIVRMPISFQFPSESQTRNDAVLFYEEGGLVTTKVWVEANLGDKLISVDGINIGGTAATDYKQQLLAHLPKLLMPSYRSELSIGLGSGILIGESARHDQLRRLVCVEISSGVLKGAEFFEKENHGVLYDPRTEIVIDDIGHFLQTTEEKFDIISADGKTTEKYSTNSFSYSKEYYELLRQRLTDGGLVIQWVPTALPASQYNLVLRTFLDAFPHVGLWYFPPVGRFFIPNTFLVGSNVEITADPDRMSRALAVDPAAFRGMSKYGLKTAEDVLSHFIAGEKTLHRLVPPGPLNSFDRPYYEFYSPADYVLSWWERTAVNNRLLRSMRAPDFEELVLGSGARPLSVDLRRAYEAEGLFLEGYEAQLGDEPYATVVDLFDRAVDLAPRSEVLRNQFVAYLMEQYRFSVWRQDYDNALGLARRAVAIYPGNAEVHENYGMILMLTQRLEEAIFELQRALELNPDLVFPRRALGVIYASQGKNSEAMASWREALSVAPNDIMTLVALGNHLAKKGSPAVGEPYLGRAYNLAPRNPAVINGYARVLYLAGDIRSAREIVRAGGAYYEGNPAFGELRSRILRAAE
jgi:spermidine synthase